MTSIAGMGKHTSGSRARIVIAVLALSCAPEMAAAHHSFSMFDSQRLVTLDATLYKVQWSNPHSWMWVTVANPAGGTEMWALQGAAPAEFARQGVTKQDFVAGLKMKIEMHPLRNGQLGGQFLRATLADGRVIGSTKTPVDILKENGFAK